MADEVEGTAIGVLTLTPLLVLALFAPLAAWQRKVAWSPAATVAVAVIALNILVYWQRGPFQGAGYDLRYFTMSVPCLVLLAVMGLKWAATDGRRMLEAGATAYVAGGALLFATMLSMAHADFQLHPDEYRQPIVIMHVLGIAAAAAILATALGRAWLGRYQPAALGASIGLGLLVSHMWVVTTRIMFHSGIAAHDGYPDFNHLLPFVHLLHDAIIEWLVPPKWGRFSPEAV